MPSRRQHPGGGPLGRQRLLGHGRRGGQRLGIGLQRAQVDAILPGGQFPDPFGGDGSLPDRPARRGVDRERLDRVHRSTAAKGRDGAAMGTCASRWS